MQSVGRRRKRCRHDLSLFWFLLLVGFAGLAVYGTDGISAQAGGDITMTSNNQFSLCIGGVPDFFPVWSYRLVL